jgi:putative FmdB family regulatory protein
MPIYTFVCGNCKIEFEAFASFQKKESGWKPDCPGCGNSQVRQALRPVAMIGGKQSPPAGGGCCSR